MACRNNTSVTRESMAAVKQIAASLIANHGWVSDHDTMSAARRLDNGVVSLGLDGTVVLFNACANHGTPMAYPLAPRDLGAADLTAAADAAAAAVAALV